MKIKFTRDEARTVQQMFFPYLLQLCRTGVLKWKGISENDTMMARLFQSIFLEIKMQIDKKLIGISPKITLSLKESECVVLYQLILRLPLDEKSIWHIQIRQKIITNIYQYLSEPTGTDISWDLPAPGQD